MIDALRSLARANPAKSIEPIKQEELRRDRVWGRGGAVPCWGLPYDTGARSYSSGSPTASENASSAWTL